MSGKSKRLFAAILCVAMVFAYAPGAFAGNYIDEDSDGVNDYQDTAYAAAAEGVVLLKNDGTLPINADNTMVSVFGRVQIDLVEGGGGSGDVNTLESEAYNFIEGMDKVGLKYYGPLYEDYANWVNEHPAKTAGFFEYIPSQTEMWLSDGQVQEAADNSDMAIVIIGRNSSEGSDCEETKGDWYLSNGEKAMLKKVNTAFEKVVVILNIPSTIDMNWVKDYSNISSILLVWQPGNYGAIAVADIIAGNVTPSGKLTDTWAYNYSDYPTNAVEGATFGTSAEDLDGDNYLDPVYAEDIYVGYRYFETFDPGAVLYEFGYGLSYTTFEQKILSYSESKGIITVDVSVTNVGKTYSGKDVVQVYYSAPQGELGKAAYELAAYAKTDELAPGKTQTLSISFDVNDMASYDDLGATGNESCYVLEAGDYAIYAGSSVRNLEEAGTYKLNSLKVIERLEEALAPVALEDENEEPIKVLTAGRQYSDGSYRAGMKEIATRNEDNDINDKYDIDLSFVELKGEDAGITLAGVAAGGSTIEEYMAQRTLSELIQLFGGTYDAAYTPSAAAGAAGTIGQIVVNTDSSMSYGVTMADGPAGMRLDIQEEDTGNTAFPIGTMLACTWNQELLKAVGEAIGKEAATNDVDIWLAPALNIHRDPMCGRNFEYYSEDPVVSGVTAAAITKGVQGQGVGVTLKHYAANNQETTRSGGNSILSERALREIYLKGFEIAVKTADPWYFMTCYNKINGTYGASSYELNTQILREEWGFKYSVMTDWFAAKDNGNTSMLRAQNDLSMAVLVWWGTSPGNLSTWPEDTAYVITDPAGTAVDVDDLVANQEKYDEYDTYLIKDAKGKYMCTVSEWRTDTTGIISGLVNGELTMGEIQRSASNVLTSMTQSLNFREENSLGKAECTDNEDFFKVEKTEAAPAVFAHESYIMGFDDGTFRADNSITRAQVASMLYNLGEIGKSAGKGKTFPDVKNSEWYYEAVMALTEAGVINGNDDGTFGPEKSITRAEFVAMIIRYTGIKAIPGSVSFSDVPDDNWAVNYIAAAVKAEYVVGFEDGTFKPGDPLSRAQTVTVINRVLYRVGDTANASGELEIFPDVSRTHYAWADIVEAAVDHEYTIADNGSEVWNAAS